MPQVTTDVNYMIKELLGLEEVLAVLDQHAAPGGTAIGRLLGQQYDRLVVLREAELEEWNETEPVKIHRCSSASKHYHTDADGPCDVYSLRPLCELHEELQLEAAEKLLAERKAYFAAKRRGEDN